MTKDKIIDYLKEKEIYETVDDTLVDELIYNIKTIDNAKVDINKRGVIVNVRSDPEADPYFQPNPSVAIYNNALKLIMSISKRLGLSPEDRFNLGLVGKELNKDGFDNF